MRIIISSLIFVLITSFSFSQSINIHKNDGSIATILLSDIDSITFTTVQNDTSAIVDIDGNLYTSVTIGTQVWMVENLRTKHFRNGDIIPDGTSVGSIAGITDPEYWFYYNDSDSTLNPYGLLYTWFTVKDIRHICPTGWHEPSDSDYYTLALYIDPLAQLINGNESATAGAKLKETGIGHWASPNSGATNEYGFTGLPGGQRSSSGSFTNITIKGYYWSSTESSSTGGWYRNLLNDGVSERRYPSDKKSAFSVRCIKD